MKRSHPVVEVLWFDAHSVDGWHKKVKHKLKPVRSVGLLIKKTKQSIVVAVAVHRSAEEPYSCAMTIPRCAIQSMRRLAA